MIGIFFNLYIEEILGGEKKMIKKRVNNIYSRNVIILYIFFFKLSRFF